jgi:FG-GAP-like repeat
MMLAQSNPVPFITQPLIPASVAPGSGGFTLTVNGTGFGRNAVVYWNGSIRSTTVLSEGTVQAQITAADVANKGTGWVTVANPGKPFSNVVYFSIRDSPAGIGFLPTSLGVSDVGPTVVGDFNNDGKLDIALGTINGSALEILLGKGNATFGEPLVTKLSTPIVYMVTGDFNGDGNLDLAVLQKFTHYMVTIFLGHGDGTFTRLNPRGAQSHATLLAVADFNGDGKLDLYLDSNDRYDGTWFDVLLGNGDGTFTDSHQMVIFGDYCTDGPPAIGDFNGDGLLDVAAIDSCSGVHVFLNSGTGFQGSAVYPIDTFGGSFITAADVNGDRKLDLVTDGVSVLLGNGDGTFKDGGGTASQAGGSLNIGDFNGDGHLDIASGRSILLGKGDGKFGPPLKFAGMQPASSSPLNMGDFNQDGKLDLLGLDADSKLSVFEQVRVYFTPVDLQFGSLIIGKTSRPKSASLTNFNANPLTILSIDITGANSKDFAQTNNCGTGLPANGSCKIQVTFSPSLVGSENASLKVTYQSSGTLSMPLSGVGKKPVTTVMLNPSSLIYAAQIVNTTSPPQTATLMNTGSQPVTISSISASAPFSQTNNCPASLAVGASCKIQVVFAPKSTGKINGALSVEDDAQGSPQKVALSGVGKSMVKLSPGSIDFGNQKVGTTSVPIPITLTNIGKTTLSISQIKINGTDAGDFAQTNNCGASVAAGGHCKITVTFTPKAKGIGLPMSLFTTMAVVVRRRLRWLGWGPRRFSLRAG